MDPGMVVASLVKGVGMPSGGGIMDMVAGAWDIRRRIYPY
jgi:hypothetical protein